nr:MULTISPECIES: transposase [Geobacillus]
MATLQEEGPWVHFISLPPYSPQRNPIERLWKWLKDTVIANVFHKDRNDIAQAIARFVDYIDATKAFNISLTEKRLVYF